LVGGCRCCQIGHDGPVLIPPLLPIGGGWPHSWQIDVFFCCRPEPFGPPVTTAGFSVGFCWLVAKFRCFAEVRVGAVPVGALVAPAEAGFLFLFYFGSEETKKCPLYCIERTLGSTTVCVETRDDGLLTETRGMIFLYRVCFVTVSLFRSINYFDLLFLVGVH
jgi:hypothetical protein